METAGNFLSILFLGAISWQDFRSRTLSAWLLPVVCITMLIAGSEEINASVIVHNAGINLLVLGFYFGLVSIWISARSRQWINIIDTHIGLGDLLFLVSIAPVFSPLNFCLFFTCATLFALLLASLLRLIKPNSNKQVPLAGYMTLLLIVFFIFRMCANIPVQTFSDEWLTSFCESTL